MDITIQIDDAYVADIDPQSIKQALQTTIQFVGRRLLQTGSVTVAITDSHTVQQLNHQYRGQNTPTDVLSFENNPDPDFPTVEPAINHHLGDIIIAYPVARTQAIARGHTVMDEITLLAVHGTLHLLGFDHNTRQQKNEMWAAQHQIMINLGLGHIQPSED